MQKKKPLPPTYFNSSILLIVIVHYLFPIIRFIYFPWNLLGLLLLAAGGVLNLLADKDFKRYKTTVKPYEYSSALITNGVFRISRNPMYLGMALLLFGESILFGSLSSFFVSIIYLFLMDFIFIRPEERMLLEKFGEEYITYKNKVRRWI
jgi:protein-S-isoprenylcysteine O-methyltransferase Ste14